MTVLHNRISQKELKELLYLETIPRITLSFYRYVSIENVQEFRDALYSSLSSLQVFGRIYVAKEGINAQISVPAEKWENFREALYAFEFCKDVRLNVAVDNDGKSFWVLKIKIREKIVADGIEDLHFDMQNKGKYVDAETFNALSDDPETIIVDMRNHYEYEIGHFDKAIEVPSDTFREQLPMAVEMLADNKNKNIIMYCTGGIRCEKASAYMLHNGFTNVYHLEGGIVHYANRIKESGLPNKFIGKNFVFDDRLGERISESVIAKCHQCGQPADNHTNCRNEACHLLFIQCEDCRKLYDGCCSVECKDIVGLPEEEQKLLRQGKQNGVMVFNKSRHRRKR
ncbi:MAG: rhodanese-related sulfurtransferase [Chitinophagaceae bacterium]